MSTTNDGGTAFPHHEDGLSGTSTGMTLRDYFAAKALQGLLADAEKFWDEAAPLSYLFADAMLAAREGKSEGGEA